jgi:hypothetical protein
MQRLIVFGRMIDKALTAVGWVIWVPVILVVTIVALVYGFWCLEVVMYAGMFLWLALGIVFLVGVAIYSIGKALYVEYKTAPPLREIWKKKG